MKKSSIVLICVVAVIVIGIAMVMGSYNGMITKQENVVSTLADLDVMLQRRGDLIPNLVNTVKGFASHEQEAINKVTDARTKLVNANNIEEKSKANDELSASLNALMVVVENYPDLKASQNFIQLSDELAGTENRIATARRDYNNAVKTFNMEIKRFPGNLLASMFGFEEAEYFEASASSMEVPNVSF